jgi:hypothetical protein
VTTSPLQARTIILRSLLVAAVIMGVSVALGRLAPEHLSTELATRLVQIMMGIVVIAYSNAIPKALTPLVQLRCAPAVEQRLRRFAGWTLTLGAVGYVLAWALAPIALAPVLAMVLLAGSLLIVLARFAWAKKGARTRAA